VTPLGHRRPRVGPVAGRRPSWLLATHRWLGALALWFLAIHLGALVADSYAHFDVADLLVPFAAGWKPIPVAAGVVALWTLVAVEATSLAIRKANRRLWHAVHLTSYLAFWLASLHGTFAGTDASNPLYVGTSVATVVTVVAALCYRVVRRRGARPAPGRLVRADRSGGEAIHRRQAATLGRAPARSTVGQHQQHGQERDDVDRCQHRHPAPDVAGVGAGP
jgi:DMSO/TMAO reductase YedYZ heme-binding membrane subunit